jgi:DNA (cytosine-5)-methyltransferase 1
MRYFSMFSGIGGFELGIQQAAQELGIQVECVGYSEIDNHAIATYEEHFNHDNYGSATTIDAGSLPDFDLLVGGFPCQSFSIAGSRKGFDEARGTLFFDVARIIAAKQPRNFILENVKGLLSHDGGRTIRVIIRTLTELGYCVEWQVLNSKNHGVPQHRERIYIVGHLGGIPASTVFPITRTCGLDLVEITRGASTSQRIYAPVLAPTIAAHGTTGGPQPPKIAANILQARRMTPLECERAQGFPDNWTVGKETQRYKQCGNAVTVNVVRDVALGLFGCHA